MPRIRTIKPEHKGHRKVGRLSDRAYRLWVGLITEADDEGRLVEDVRQMRAGMFGFQERTTTRHVQAALEELLLSTLLQRYVIKGIAYLAFPSWHHHQVINRPRPSTYPPPPADPAIHGTFTECSVNDHGTFTERSRGNDRTIERTTDLGVVVSKEPDRPEDPIAAELHALVEKIGRPPA